MVLINLDEKSGIENILGSSLTQIIFLLEKIQPIMCFFEYLNLQEYGYVNNTHTQTQYTHWTFLMSSLSFFVKKASLKKRN